MAKRNRTNPVQFYLNDDEQYILDEKFKLSGMKSKSAFLRKLILYGYVYEADYSYLRNYNTELGRISSSLNQIAKRINSTDHIYKEDMDEVKELMNEVWHTQKSILYNSAACLYVTKRLRILLSAKLYFFCSCISASHFCCHPLFAGFYHLLGVKKADCKNGSKKMIYYQLFSYKPLYICLKWCTKKGISRL